MVELRQGGKYTGILGKVVRKSACDNPERYCGWFALACCPARMLA